PGSRRRHADPRDGQPDDPPEGRGPRDRSGADAGRARRATGRPRLGRTPARACLARARRGPPGAGRGSRRLRRAARAPDRGRRRPVPDAVALRTLRAQPDVQPGLRHAAGRARDRRPRRHGGRLHAAVARGRFGQRLQLRGPNDTRAARGSRSRARRVARSGAVAPPSAKRHDARLELADRGPALRRVVPFLPCPCAMSGAELLLSSLAALLIGARIGGVGIGGVLLVPWLTQAIGLPVRDAVAIAMLGFVATGAAALVIAARSVRDPATMRWPLVVATVPGA